jgi:hypothetical protein
MEGRPKDGKRRRLSFRYDPRLFSRLESIWSQAWTGNEPIEQAAFHRSQQAFLPSLMLLGYSQEARKPVLISEGHTLVCGIPGQSGKTTCIEGLLSRWPGNERKKKKIIAFISKRGEGIFFGLKKIDPFINTSPDPDFLSLVVESMLIVKRRPQVSRKINLIMAELCHNAKSLKQVLRNTTRMKKKAERYSDRLRHHVCIALEYYLTNILPHQDQQSQNDPEFRFANSIEFDTDNNNVVINISHLSEEVQTLVIGSVAYEILKNHHDTVLVVPDGWTIFASNGSSLGRFHVESLIAEGLPSRNYVTIESVIIEEVPLHVRRQMSTILLGYQASGEEAGDEIRALRDLTERIRRSKAMKAVEKPFLTSFNIQRLKVGEFYAFPSYIEEQGAWRVNKVSTIPPQTSKEEAIAHSSVMTSQ